MFLCLRLFGHGFICSVCFMTYNLETLVCYGDCFVLMELKLEAGQTEVHWVMGLCLLPADLLTGGL